MGYPVRYLVSVPVAPNVSLIPFVSLIGLQLHLPTKTSIPPPGSSSIVDPDSGAPAGRTSKGMRHAHSLNSLSARPAC